MQNKKFYAAVALTTATTTNILNPPAASGGVNGGSSGQYILVSHMRVVNKTSSNRTVSLWRGATGGNAAGTEYVWQGKVVPANDAIDYYSPGDRFDASDFLVGGADAASSLTLQIIGEIGVAG